MTDLSQPDEARCWAKAREVIEKYGDDVDAFLELMIDTCGKECEMQLLMEWLVIRTCVAMILNGNGSTAAH
ncbi:hypothetical protein [Sphingobium sp. EP60837]|uniref:hypothetical protein n=1 Tax=Sphingobium sp. EP60837 TaxID=1855519 RepID=UPI0007DCE1A6|nr:hypothetical protein [Sphingobium sp. EP60837]ANI80302.1 hypothetical protein EP837_03924 [Sphingobium sp. EP60837]